MHKGGFFLAVFVLVAFSTFSVLLSNALSSRSTRVLGSRSVLDKCTGVDALPDRDCTPGAVVDTVNIDQLCQGGREPSPEIPVGLQSQVLAMYRHPDQPQGELVIDQLISSNLGGSMDIANLWPQSVNSHPGYEEKNLTEDYLLGLVCSHQITLKQAQDSLAGDWLRVFLRMPL